MISGWNILDRKCLSTRSIVLKLLYLDKTSFIVIFAIMTPKMISDSRASHAFQALGNSTRLSLFRLLVKAGPEGLNVGEIQNHLGIPPSTLAHHLAGLKSAGLIEQVRNGREILSKAQFGLVDDLIIYLTAECCLGVENELETAV